MEDYEELRTIGKGSFGKAVLVRRRSDGLLLVLKQINIMEMAPRERNDAMNEVQVLSMLDHENIIAYHDSFLVNGTLYIGMEYANAGDIHQEIKKRTIQKSYFTEDQIWTWFTQICLAVQYMNSKNILHRDLKTQNIFLSNIDNRSVVKVGDMGIAKILNSDTSFARTVIGTPYYLSPEICEDRPYDHKSDIWSLGCVLYELATLKHAFNAGSLPALVLKILKGNYPPIPTMYSSDMRSLISFMLRTDPKQRPSVDNILSLPFIQTYVQIARAASDSSVANLKQSSPSTSTTSAAPSPSPSRPQTNIPMAMSKAKPTPSITPKSPAITTSPINSVRSNVATRPRQTPTASPIASKQTPVRQQTSATTPTRPVTASSSSSSTPRSTPTTTPMSTPKSTPTKPAVVTKTTTTTTSTITSKTAITPKPAESKRAPITQSTQSPTTPTAKPTPIPTPTAPLYTPPTRPTVSIPSTSKTKPLSSSGSVSRTKRTSTQPSSRVTPSVAPPSGRSTPSGRVTPSGRTTPSGRSTPSGRLSSSSTRVSTSTSTVTKPPQSTTSTTSTSTSTSTSTYTRPAVPEISLTKRSNRQVDLKQQEALYKQKMDSVKSTLNLTKKADIPPIAKTTDDGPATEQPIMETGVDVSTTMTSSISTDDSFSTHSTELESCSSLESSGIMDTPTNQETERCYETQTTSTTTTTEDMLESNNTNNANNNNNNEESDEKKSQLRNKKLHTRAVALRHFCNSIFGEETFNMVYGVLKDVCLNSDGADSILAGGGEANGDDDDQGVQKQLEELLGDKIYYLKYLQQLLYCESQLSQ
ncbi:hypothetical protein SAMD00019534_061060 [Acytostelium subglobosum LB1]|uniref:hypothetical protein n=1 Tax=Acytostelium subglobosum LB1 TaxID=1410327 RepID=UPI000644D8EB|nr:hypothetical protein SAMD00019534_061060 [Acytostelium subglobosum LB1]GAM22931.1 hypothetical protein SAMD00019534_061060 [Acytostelium subglobosum LB1]|eukprot:XP_012754158.1 hypothetical protein SAMD00019534_061060 [Acytostelium subglobosum LB1]